MPKICSYRFERARRTASWPQQSQVLMAYQETYHRMDLLETLRSTWVSLGKSSPIFKFKYGPSCFLKVFVVIFDFEVGVPGFY